jgi:hypothetical protein
MEYKSPLEEQTAKKIKKKWETMQTMSSMWKSHWDEVAKYVLPMKNNIYGYRADGEKKGQYLFDTYAIHAMELLASALHGMLTNPASVWFGLLTEEDELNKKDNVQKFLQTCTTKMIDVLNSSNFQTEVHEYFIDLVGFGTGTLNVEEDDKDVIRFRSAPIYDFGIEEDHRGQVETIYYRYEMSVAQIAEKFGTDKFTYELNNDMQHSPEKKKFILHAVEPISEYKEYHKNLPAFAYASFHIIEGDCIILKESGYFSHPFIISRWTKLSGEVYGRAPAMKALADIKMVNEMKRTTIEAAQLTIAPPMLLPDEGVMLPFKMAPRSQNFYRSGSKDEVKPLNTGVNVNIGEQLIEQNHKIIDKAFYIDQLKIHEADRMTATEIIQRRDEQLRTLGPILGRQHHEFLKPLVERIFDIMSRKGLLPAPPQELSGKKIKVKYTSQIAKAQQAAEGDQVVKAFQLINPFIGLDPTVIDNIDLDELVRFSSNIYGVPHEILRDKNDVKALRDGRQQAHQEMAQQQQALNQSQVAMNMNKAGQLGTQG